MSMQKTKKKNNVLSFTSKCIIFANIQNETDKNLINSFDFTPVVKLYTSTTKQETFNYSKIRGPLFLFQDSKKEDIFYIRIYDIKDYSLRFNLEINSETRKNYMKIEPNFYCFYFKFGCIGFQFSSSKDAEMFKNMLDAGAIEREALDEYEQYKSFLLKDSDNLYLDVIDGLVAKFGKLYQIITLGEELDQNFHQVSQYLIFSGFLELSQLVCNTEFDYEDNLYNIYIDKKYSLKLFRKMFYSYNKSHLYPLRPIVHDYLNVYNKSNYVDLLVGHLMNNFKEQIQIYKKRKENNLKEKNIKGLQPSDTILEDEEYTIDEGRTTGNSIGRFFYGLNPFKLFI